MNTGSVIIKRTIAILGKLNYYFEHSLIYRLLAAIGAAAAGSVILKSFTGLRSRDYFQGSLIMRLFEFVAGGALVGVRHLYMAVSKANETSLNKKFFDLCVMPLSESRALFSAFAFWLSGAFLVMAPFRVGSLMLPIFGASAVILIAVGVFLPGFWTKAIWTCVPVRLLRWFFGSEEGIADNAAAGQIIETQSHKSLFFRTVHLLIGISIGLVFVLMPLRIAAMLAVGGALAVFTFFNLKLSYMFFFMGMLMVPSPMWNNMLIFLSALFYAGVYGLKWLGSGSGRPSFKHISPALILFVGFCLLSIFTGYGGMDSMRVFVIFFSCVVHSVLIINIMKSMEDLKLFFLILAVAVAFTSLFGVYQLMGGIEISAEFTDLVRSEGLTRLYSTLGNPNNDAESWSMLLPFILAATIATKSDMKRVILAGVILVCLAAFMLTYSRAGYIALAAGVGVFVLMSAPRLVPIGIVALLLALPFVPASIIDRLLTIGQDTSSAYRFMIWQGTIRMLENFWVQGIGMGPEAFIRIYRGYSHPLAWNAMHAHNMFLNIMAHSGIGALVAFLAYLFRLFKQGISAHVNTVDKEFKIYMAAGIGSLTAFVVFGMAEYVWFYPRVMLIFWLMAGIILAMTNIKKNTQRSN